MTSSVNSQCSLVADLGRTVRMDGSSKTSEMMGLLN